MIQIAIINESSVITDAQLAVIVAAVQVQVSRDFAPVWGRDATLHIGTPRSESRRAFICVASGKAWSAAADKAALALAPSGEWQIAILDTSDQAAALGYHDLTPEGLPLGKVFAKSDLEAGMVVSASISRAVLSMLADPDISRLALRECDGKTFVYAVEVCDPCAADRWNYPVEVRIQDSGLSPPGQGAGIQFVHSESRVLNSVSVDVADFVYPQWFHTNPADVSRATLLTFDAPVAHCEACAAGFIPTSDGRCGAYKPNILGVPEPQDRCTKPHGHEGKHSLNVGAPTLTEKLQEVLQVACPVCFAGEGLPCVSLQGEDPIKDGAFHSGRLEIMFQSASSANSQSEIRNPKFDHAGHMRAAFEVLEGGYIGCAEVALSWRELQHRPKTIDSLAAFAQSGMPDEMPLHYNTRPQVGSRRERRRTWRSEWQKSITNGRSG